MGEIVVINNKAFLGFKFWGLCATHPPFTDQGNTTSLIILAQITLTIQNKQSMDSKMGEIVVINNKTLLAFKFGGLTSWGLLRKHHLFLSELKGKLIPCVTFRLILLLQACRASSTRTRRPSHRFSCTGPLTSAPSSTTWLDLPQQPSQRSQPR